jgi:probable F420-dependent oxidoreductase
MRLGAYLYPPGGGADPEHLVAMAAAAEELEFDSVWLGDHVAWPLEFDPGTHDQVGGGAPPAAVVHSNVLEPFTALAFVSARVQRIRIGFGVLVLPYRSALLNGKMLAMLDVLSGGRLIAGVGTGWLKEEFPVLGAPPYEERGRVADTQLRLLEELWSGDTSTLGVVINPKPVQRPRPPVWVGGNGEAALRRAARFGDAWMPLHQSPEQIRSRVERLRTLVSREGRDPLSVGVVAGCRFRITEESVAEPGTMIGTTAQLAARLLEYGAAGVGQINLIGEGYPDLPSLVGDWEILSRVSPA